MKWSPVSRHHVVAALVSRSRGVRASPAARQTSPAARQTSPAATPPTAAVLESYRTPTFIDNNYRTYSEHVDADMHEDDVEDKSEHNFEDEKDAEEDEQDVEEDEYVTASASVRALTSKFRSEAWKEYVPLTVNGQVSKGRCKHCDKMISAKRGAGTSALLKHLDRCKQRDIALRIVHLDRSILLCLFSQVITATLTSHT